MMSKHRILIKVSANLFEFYANSGSTVENRKNRRGYMNSEGNNTNEVSCVTILAFCLETLSGPQRRKGIPNREQ